MTRPNELPYELLHDELVQFIARRHSTSAEIILNVFVAQSTKHDPTQSIILESNEMQIIHDLINIYS